MAESLLPCPFCGGEAAFEEVEDRASSNPEAIRFSVGCGNEDCIGCQSMTSFSRRIDAITAWNRRAGVETTQRHICPGCGNEIDPNICGCGSPITHSSWEGHQPVPMGCDCMRVAGPEASGEATGPEGDDSNMGTAPTSGPEATSSQGNAVETAVVHDGRRRGCPVCRRVIEDDEVLGSCMHTKDGKHRRVLPEKTSRDEAT